MTFFSSLRQWTRPAPAKASVDQSVYRVLAEHVSDILFHFTSNAVVTYVSPSVERILGYSSELVVGTDTLWFVFEEDRPALIEGIGQLQRGEIRQLRHQARVLRADGDLIWIEGSCTISEDGTGSFILVMRDIADRKRVEEEMAAVALKDDLTELGNRRAFDRALDHEWNCTVSEQSQLSLLLLDLDHFKQFNDRYGHQAGDDCLRTVAAAIQAALTRPNDVACRYGGEELAVILGGTGMDDAIDIAESIRRVIETLQIPHPVNSGASVVTVSIGVATALSRVGGTIRMPEGLLQAADHALYRAKNEGRNRLATSLLLMPGNS